MSGVRIVSVLGATVFLGGAQCSAQGPTKPLSVAAPDVFSDTDRKAVVGYWSAPGRYTLASSPDSPTRINITVAGSVWYGRFGRLVSSRPKNDPEAATWRTWVQSQMASDKAACAPPPPGVVASSITMRQPLMPDGLKSALGEPPPFYEIVRPQQYTVTFAPDDAPTPFVYTDNIGFAKRATYFTAYRQTAGVIKMGDRVRDATGAEKARIDALFASVGRTDAERHVLQAVSTLEGGFESINTYDTGYVSVGLIQFIFAKDGDGSLASVLARMKKDDPSAFASDFHRFGVDVDANGIVDVVSPATGKEVHGADAVQAVIADKRLTAVFERAGAHDAFRKAQILIARQQYWPADDVVTVTRYLVFEQKSSGSLPALAAIFYGAPDAPAELQSALAALQAQHKSEAGYRAWIVSDAIAAPVSTFVNSEAGLATLMDRKVNRGNIGDVPQVAAAILQTNKLTQMSDLAPYERTLLQAMKYRADFLKDATLTQPPAPPAAATPIPPAS